MVDIPSAKWTAPAARVVRPALHAKEDFARSSTPRQAGAGMVIDWVPAHFPDAHGWAVSTAQPQCRHPSKASAR